MSIEAMKQAVEALEKTRDENMAYLNFREPYHEAITALRQAIAEAEKQEPVAWQKDAVFDASIEFIKTLTGMEPPPIEIAPPEVFAPFRQFSEKVCEIFSTHPPKRKWVGLTDEEMAEAIGFTEFTVESTKTTLTYIARTIEAKLKEKNHG